MSQHENKSMEIVASNTNYNVEESVYESNHHHKVRSSEHHHSNRMQDIQIETMNKSKP